MSRADLHCHSTASAVSKLGVQRALGLPECATPPEEVHALAKRRGMDFVTITDHDTIDGVLALADRPDVFLSVELTARFKGEPQAVHVLCLGLTPDDFGALREVADDVERVADLLRDRDVACALAHPFYAVGAPLTPRHRRRLAELFDIWEVRNGARAPELNAPAAVYVETHGGTGVGGSDDHAGVDIGRTWTATPRAESPEAFLRYVRAGLARAGGEEGSAAKWAHAAMAIAVRALGHEAAAPEADGPDPRAVLRMVERVLAEGDARAGALGTDLSPADARALLGAWLGSVGLDHLDGPALLAVMQDDGFRHDALFRRARRAHERRLAAALDEATAAAATGAAALALLPAAAGVLRACTAAVPYAPAAAFLGREKDRLTAREGAGPRVALVADGVGSVHGVTRVLEELRERDVPGFAVEVIGTDPHVDRRLSAVRDVELPHYPGLRLGVPGLPALVEALAEGRYDAVHVCSPGPAGAAAAVLARVMGLPLVGSYHTELAAYAALRTGDPVAERLVRTAVAAFYGACDVVLSPSPATDATLRGLGVEGARVRRFDRGVDAERFHPGLRDPALLPGAVSVLYAGRLSREKGVDLLADAFLAAHADDPRLHLCLAGDGPEEGALRARLGAHATFLGWLEGDDLARTYASADAFLFASRTDTFGQVLLEAQASGVPVVAVAEGGPCSLVAHGRTGLLAPPDAVALAAQLRRVTGAPGLAARLGRQARAAVGARSWEHALGLLADGYHAALDGAAAGARDRRAA